MITAKDIINEISLLGTSGSVAASISKTPQVTPKTEKVYTPEGTSFNVATEKLTGFLSNRGKFFADDNYGRFSEPDMPDGSGLNQKIDFVKQHSVIGNTDITKKVF